jgi:hypothetical protein
MSIFFFLIKVIIIALIIELFPQKDMKEDIERCYYDKKITSSVCKMNTLRDRVLNLPNGKNSE